MTTYIQLACFTLIFSFFSVVSLAQDGEPTDSTKNEPTYGFGDGEQGGQDGEDGEDGDVVIEFSIGDEERDTSKNLLTRWFTLGLGVNALAADGDFDLPDDNGFYNDFDIRIGKSTNVDLGIVQQKLNLIDHHLYLHSGIGLDVTKYMFDSNFVIDPDSDDWSTMAFDADTKKNRLTATYIHVPLMLNFETSNKHYQSFRLNVGGFGGLRLGSNQKIKFEDKDDNFLDDNKKYKEKDNFNLSTINYGFKTEVGYGPINLYGKYHVNDLVDGESELNNLSIGLMVIPF